MTFDFASKDKLLGIEQICEKLGISRSTFERRFWRSNDKAAMGSLTTLGTIGAGLALADEFMHGKEYEGAPPFPPPTVVIGRSPRWAVSVLNAWVAEQPQSKS